MDDFPPRRRAGDPSTGRSGTALRSQPERVRPEEEIRARTRKDAPRLRGLRSTAIHGNIEIRGARQDNLRDVSLDIPKGKITVFTGVSGSGKSSLVSGTIAAESQRLVNETYTAFLQGLMPHYGQPDADSLRNLSAAIVVDQKRLGGTSRSTVGTVTDTYAMLRLLFARVGTPHVGPAHLFSFNDPRACAASARAWAAARPSTWTSWSTAAVFDEPGVGLHPHDVHRLNDLLGQLCDKGNTVLVVEHRPTAIEIADAEGLASLSMRPSSRSPGRTGSSTAGTRGCCRWAPSGRRWAPTPP